MRKHLYINDIDICEYGIYISSDTYLNSPLIDYKEYQIPARNGNVIQYNKRLNNVIRRFDCYIHENTNIKSALFNLKKLLYNNVGYLKLVSDYDTEIYQYGYLAQDIEVEPFQFEHTATFSLYFSCLPQKYFVDDIKRSIGGFNNRTAQGIYSNDSIPVKLIKNNSSMDYPNTQIGWIISYGGNASYDTGQVLASSTTHKYFAVLERNASSSDEWYWVGETESGQFTLDSYTEHGGVICTAVPLVDTNPIYTTSSFNGVATTGINFSWQEKTSEYLLNEEAFGYSPKIIFQIYFGTSTANSGDYYFAFNDKIIRFNSKKFFDDVGIAFAKENYTHKSGSSSYFELYFDLQNSLAYLLDGFDIDANTLFDISGYIEYFDDLEFDGTDMTIKFFVSADQMPIANTPRDIMIQMGWWTL